MDPDPAPDPDSSGKYSKKNLDSNLGTVL
jgi:hypothetical protein